MKLKKETSVTVFDVICVYWEKLSPYRWLMAIMLVTILVSNIVQVIVPLYYKKFFDILGKYAGDTSNISAATVPLEKLILLILGLHFLNLVASRITSFSNMHLEAWTMSRLRQHAFNYMVRHSYHFFTNNFTGSLVQRVARLSRGFERLVDRITFDVIPLFIQIVGTTIILWGSYRLVAVMILVWTALFLGFNYIFAKWKLKYDVARAAADSRTTGALADALTNQSTIQLFASYSSEIDRFKDISDDQTRKQLLSWNLTSWFDAVQGLLIIVVEFLVFYFGIHYWEAGVFTIGTFALLQAYIINLSEKLWSFSRVVRDIYESFADAKEMVEILKLPYEVKDLPGATELKVTEGEIKLQNVSFYFNETRTVLNKLNLTIKGGEKVALVGPSGAGKSTFVKLLLRLFDVGGGAVSIDGQDIAHVTQDSLRTAVSFVPQDPVLFHRTLMENIRYGNPKASDEEVKEAARLAHCAEFIDNLPDGYETYVGERGIKLSGGERQRVAIARAILKNAPIIILDEATSSLDSESESLIQDALEKLMKGRTTIVIAHRLSTIRNLDRVVVLADGKVLEEGTHDDLTKNKESMYYRLWELQSGGYIKDDIGN